jgi:hypothetical protein
MMELSKSKPHRKGAKAQRKRKVNQEKHEWGKEHEVWTFR